MQINPTPLGVLLGTVFYPEADAVQSRYFNRFDLKLFEYHGIRNLENKLYALDSHNKYRRPLLSTDLYYKWISKQVECLTPSGMFEYPEKSQIYLEVIKKGAINASKLSLLSTNRYQFFSYSELFNNEETRVYPMGFPSNESSRIKATFKNIKKFNIDLFNKFSTTDINFILVGRNSFVGNFGGYSQLSSEFLMSTTLVSSIGELLVQCELYTKSISKANLLYIYIDTEFNVRVMTEHKIKIRDIKYIIKYVVENTSFTHGTQIYKLILTKALFTVLEKTGELFDFALNMSKEQQCSLVKEALWAGFGSGISAPQDGSLTDLLAYISSKVTLETYTKGRLVSRRKSI